MPRLLCLVVVAAAFSFAASAPVPVRVVADPGDDCYVVDTPIPPSNPWVAICPPDDPQTVWVGGLPVVK